MANILYIAQFFGAHSQACSQGQRHYQHAMALSQDGHAVTVITQSIDEQPSAVLVEQLNPNLKVIRFSVGSAKSGSAFKRAKNGLGFSAKALLHGIQLRIQNKQAFNFVLGSSPPLSLTGAGYLLSRMNRAAFYMEVGELWSQHQEGKNLLSTQLGRLLENWLYRSSRKILIESPAFCETIERQVPGSTYKTEYIPNGVDLELYQAPLTGSASYLRDISENQTRFHINYAGMLDADAHLETVLQAASHIQAELPNVQFNFVGDGEQAEAIRLQAEAMQLKNVRFWGALPQNRMSQLLMEGDLSLINYRALDYFGQVLPSQLLDSMAAGKPVLAAVAPGQISRVLHESKAGMTVPPENMAALVEAIRWFYQNREQGLQMGRHGFQHVQRHFNRKLTVERLLKLFPRVIPLHHLSGLNTRPPINSPPLTGIKIQ